MSAITTTLAKIKAQRPCEDGYRKLVKSLGGITKYGNNTPITFEQIYASNGYEDTLWCMRAVDKHNFPLWRHFAVDAAQAVEHLMTDKCSIDALVVARRHADGSATDEELSAARDAAWTAASAAAWTAASAAAWAAATARAAAAAWAAAKDAAAAWDAAKDAARAAQMRLLFDYCREGKRPENSVELLKQYIKEEMEKGK